ncbi:MAG: head GIN domain-containing protein [Bacteroidales bacterium]
MKKHIERTTALFTMIMMISFILSGCVIADNIPGDGNVVSEDRNVSGFDEIEVGGAYHVYLTLGNKETLKIEAEENLMEYIITEVRGGTLKIYNKKGLEPTKDMDVFISLTDLKALDISGACDVVSQNTLELDNLDINASGASDIELVLRVPALTLDLSGASDIDLNGEVQDFDVAVSGAAELEAYDLLVQNCRLDVSGAGSAKVHVKTKLDVTVSGAGSARYKGDPDIHMSVSGAGSLSKY